MSLLGNILSSLKISVQSMDRADIFRSTGEVFDTESDIIFVKQRLCTGIDEVDVKLSVGAILTSSRNPVEEAVTTV
jgi:hypothetical protein